MVIKVVALGVVVAVGVGIAVYEQREPLREFADRQRVKLAELLRRLADELSSEPMAYGGRRRPSVSSSSDSADNFTYRDFSEKSIPEREDENVREEELNEKGESSATNAAGNAGLRRRGGGGIPDSSVIFETTLSSTVVEPQQEEESGYETGLPPARSAPSSGRATPSSHTLSDSDFDTYQSIHEWQENTAAAHEIESVSSASLAGSGESEIGSDVDIQSVAGSWTEVDSVVSDDPFA